MNERRDFLKKTVLLAGGITLAASNRVFASNASFPSNIVYTKDDPGIWGKKVGSHLPVVAVEGNKVTVTTKHPMTEKHYIVRHTLVSADGKALGAKTFAPTDKEAVSVYELSGTPGQKVYATSFCNLHDFWVTEFTF